MTTSEKQFSRPLPALSAGAVMALLGLLLTACSPADTAPPAESTSAASSTVLSTPAVSETTPTAEAGQHNISVKVTGARASALVKTVVVGSEGEENGGEMRPQTLPYTETFTASSNSGFTKVFVLAKYDSGQTADISCSITVDGEEVAASTSSNHVPVECLFLNKGSK